MTDDRQPFGFEEALRPPVDVRRARITRPVLRPPGPTGDRDAYGQLARLVRGASEVMVKVTGRTGNRGDLRIHLDYLTDACPLRMTWASGGRDAPAPTPWRPSGRWRPTSPDPAQGRAPHAIHHSEHAGRNAGPCGRGFGARLSQGRLRRSFRLGLRAPRRGPDPHVHLTVRALGARRRTAESARPIWRHGGSSSPEPCESGRAGRGDTPPGAERPAKSGQLATDQGDRATGGGFARGRLRTMGRTAPKPGAEDPARPAGRGPSSAGFNAKRGPDPRRRGPALRRRADSDDAGPGSAQSRTWTKSLDVR